MGKFQVVLHVKRLPNPGMKKDVSDMQTFQHSLIMRVSPSISQNYPLTLKLQYSDECTLMYPNVP